MAMAEVGLPAEVLTLKHESRILGQCICFKEEPSQFYMGKTAVSNLLRNGETAYRVGRMS